MKNKIIIPKIESKKNILQYFRGLKIFSELLKPSAEFLPNFEDLYFIHKLIVLNKRLTILEFGTGWSTFVIKNAININKKKYFNSINKLRMANKFEIFVVDDSKKYLTISKNRIDKFYGKKNGVHFTQSKVKMDEFNCRYVSSYNNLPKCNPDFIYLDAPSSQNVKNSINGFNMSHSDLMPMSCDILKFEHFLCPGTIILIDGRTANARFLKSNFQRKWKYVHNFNTDHHIFYLDEKPLGKHNKLQINFYKKKF